MNSQKIKKTASSHNVTCCIVCQETHSTLKSFLICTKCENPMCKIHSKSINDLPFCDVCIKNEVKSQVQQEFQGPLNSLAKELKTYQEHQDIYLSKIKKKQVKLNKLEQNIQEILSKSEVNVNELSQKLAEQELKNRSDELDRLDLLSQLADSEKFTQSALSQCSSAQGEILKVSSSIKSSEKILKALQATLEEQILNCKSTIPYRRLRNTICVKCHKELKRKMKDSIFKCLNPKNSQQLIESLYMNRSTNLELRDRTPCACICF